MDSENIVNNAAECMISAEQSRAHIDELFKGYIPVGSGKKISVRWQDSENWQTYDSIVSKNGYAGVLRDDIIVVDVDNREAGELMLKAVKELGVKTRVHRTTKGWHFFFRRGPNDVSDRQTKLVPACGLGWHREIADKGKDKGQEVTVGDVDYLAGWSGAILILKVDGVTRDVVYETEEIGVCPRWLQPLQERGRTCHPITYELQGLGEGDGRNDIMNRFMGVLKNREYSWEEAEETAWVVNNFTFSEPMCDSEFESVTRRDYYEGLEVSTGNGRGRPRGSTAASGDKPEKYQHNLVGDELMEDLHIIMLDGLLMVFNGKVYIRGEEYIEDKLRQRYPHALDSNVTNTISYITSRVRDWSRDNPPKVAPPTHIAVRNGILDTDTGLLSPHDPEEVILNYIDWDYNPDAECEDVDKALDNVTGGDANMRALLEEMMGYCMYRENTSTGKFFVLLGDKSNGKSSILKPLRKMLSVRYTADPLAQNTTALSIQDLDGRFNKAELYHKLANINEDLPATYMAESDILKQIVTGDSIQAEEKGKKPFSYIPYCKLIFACNEMPTIKDPTGAVAKRLIPIPFNVTFGPEYPNWDPKIGKKITTDQAMERWLKLAVDGLMRYLNNGENFTTYNGASELLEDVKRMNNPLIGFVEDVLDNNLEAIIGQPLLDVYEQHYRPWMNRVGGVELSFRKFNKEMKSTYKLVDTVKKIDGKATKVWEWRERVGYRN